MKLDDEIEALAESYINGNISHVVNAIRDIGTPDEAMYVAVSVYDRLAFRFEKPLIAMAFLRALARNAAVTCT